MAHIDLNELEPAQVDAIRVMRKYGTAKIYLHNDELEGLASAKAVEVLEAKGYVEVLPPDTTDGDDRKLMRARIRPGVEDMGDKFMVTFHEPWITKDGSVRKDNRSPDITIPAGTYTMVRTENPDPMQPAPWLVVEGTMIGQTEGSLRQWDNNRVEIEPDIQDGLMTAARMYGLRLSDYQGGEDVTGLQAKLNRLQGAHVSLGQTMLLIERMANVEDTANLKPWQQHLVAALRRAAHIASLYSLTEDGGTCNMDNAVILPEPSWKEAEIERAADVAGIRVRVSQWMKRRCIFVYINEGQGSRRTRMVEAAEKALKAAGLNTSVYYQMD